MFHSFHHIISHMLSLLYSCVSCVMIIHFHFEFSLKIKFTHSELLIEIQVLAVKYLPGNKTLHLSMLTFTFYRNLSSSKQWKRFGNMLRFRKLIAEIQHRTFLTRCIYQVFTKIIYKLFPNMSIVGIFHSFFSNGCSSTKTLIITWWRQSDVGYIIISR